MSVKMIHKNKKAFFNYEIVDTFEAGIILKGHEVKSIKSGQINLQDAFVRIEGEEAWLWNANVTQYKYANITGYDPTRRRKLLLKKREIAHLMGKSKERKLTIIPLKVYLSRGKVKLEIGLARGKKRFEKKRKIKERDLERELHRKKREHMVK